MVVDMGIRMRDMDTLLKVTHRRGYPTLLRGPILLHLLRTLRNMGTLRLVDTTLLDTLAMGAAMAEGTWDHG